MVVSPTEPCQLYISRLRFWICKAKKQTLDSAPLWVLSTWDIQPASLLQRSSISHILQVLGPSDSVANSFCSADNASLMDQVHNHSFFLNYLFEREKERERERERAQAEGRSRGRSRLPTKQGTWCGALSQNPGIMTWPKGRCIMDWATQVPRKWDFWSYNVLECEYRSLTFLHV